MKDYKIDLSEYPTDLLYDVNRLIASKACKLGYNVTDNIAQPIMNTGITWDFHLGKGVLMECKAAYISHTYTETLSMSEFLCLPEPTKFVVGNLYKGELGTVVLCTAEAKDGNLGNEFSGISIARDSGISYMIGMTSDTWNCSVFKPFNGTIVDGVLNES